MKSPLAARFTSRRSRKSAIGTLLPALGLLAALPAAKAATYTWTPTAAGTFNWDSAANWGGAAFPNAVGDVANLTSNLAGAETVNLNVPITLGTLNIGDPTATFYAFTIATGTAGSLIFSNGGSSAILSTSNVATGITNTISANIALNDNLIADVQNTNQLAITGVISETGGSRSLTKTSTGTAGTLTLSNGANSYTGATSIAFGALNLVLNGDIGLSTNSVIGNAASAVNVGTSATTGSAQTTLTFQAGSDASNYTMFRAIDTSISASTGQANINFNGDGAGGANTNTLTLAGDITLAATAHQTLFNPQRSGMSINITGNILQAAAGTGGVRVGGFPAAPSATDGRGTGTVRFSNLSRNYTGSNLLITGTILIDGTVGALNTASPIGQATIDIAQGSGGNAFGGANFNGSGVFSDLSADINRAVYLDTAGSSFARVLAPGTGSSTNPLVSNYGSIVGVINGYQFGGRNTSGTVTFSGNITPGDIQVGSSATNPVTVAENIALIAENGGTSVFSGVISDSSVAATNARLTINQVRNHPNIDGTNNAGTTITSDGNADTVANNGATNYTADRLVGTAKTGTVLLSGANSYVGTVEVLGGTLQLGNTRALGSLGLQSTATGTTTIASGAVLDLNGTASVNEPIILNGTGIASAGALVNNSGTAASIGNGIAGLQIAALTGSGSGYSAAPTVTISGTGTGATATASLGLTTASITSITSGGTGYAVGDTVNIVGGGGTGALAVVTSVSGGVVTGLSITKPGSGYTTAPTGFSKNTSTNGAGTQTVSGNATNFTVAGLTLTVAGTGYTGTPTVTISAGAGTTATATATLSSVTLASDTSVGGTGDTTINSVVSESGGARALTKVGAGTTTLTAANTYTGATTISVGKLQLGNAGTTGSLSTSSAITDNGNLTINRTNAVTQGTDFSGAAITGSGSFTQAGTGATTLNAANSYAGTTTIAAGILNAGIADGAGTGALGSGGNISFTGGTLQYSAASAATDYSARIKNSTGAITIDTNAQSVTFASALDVSNSGGLTKLGAGTLTLSGNNTFTGAIGITNGTLSLGSAQSGTGGPLGGTGTVASIGTITFGTGANNGTLQFSAANTADYSGRFGTTANQNFNIDTNGQTVTFNSGFAPSSLGTFTKSGLGTLIVNGSNGNTLTGITTISAGTLQVGNGSTTGKLSNASAIVNNGVLFFNRSNNVSQGTDFSNGITGSGSLVFSAVNNSYGVSSLNSAANAYTGTTTISNGYLTVGPNSILSGVAGPLGNATSAIVLGDANTVASTYGGAGPNVVLVVTGANDTNVNNYSITRNIDSTSAANVAGRSDIAFGSNNANGVGTLTVSGNWALSTGNVRSYGLWAQRTGQTLDYTGVISGGNSATSFRTGDFGQGVGFIRLSNVNNSYASRTSVAAGTLLIAGDAASATGVLGANTTLNLGDFTNANTSALIDGAFTVGKAVTLSDIVVGTNTWTLGGNQAAVSSFTGNVTPFSLAYSPTLNLSQVAGGTVTFTGILGPNPNTTYVVNVAKIGAGTVVLTGANTYDGTTNVSAGTLQVGNGSTTGTLPVSSAITIDTDATLAVNRSNTATQGTDFSATAITGAGSFVQSGSGVTTLNAANAYGGTTTVSAGTLVIAGNQSGTGQINVTDATLQFGNGTSMSGSQANSAISANNVSTVNLNFSNSGSISNVITSNSGVTTLSGTNATGTNNTFVGAATSTGGSFTTLSTTAGATLTFSNPSAFDIKGTTLNVTGPGNTTVSGSVSNSTGSGSVTKNDSGTLIFSGNNSYSGGTAVNAGTLLANNIISSTGSGTVIVNNTGSLGGTGTISGATTINAGGTITGANIGSIGTLTLQSDLTFAGLSSSSLATYVVDIGSGTNNSDSLAIGGVLNLSGSFDQITFTGSPDGTSSYVLATYASASGTFDNGSAPAGYSFQYNGTELDLVPTPVPEPGTVAVGLLAFGTLGFSQRRRVRRWLDAARLEKKAA